MNTDVKLNNVNTLKTECVDYAKDKVAFELCNHPEFMTMEGDNEEYGTSIGDKYGYLGIHHPANITLDLLPNLGRDEKGTVGVRQISIKFMHPNDALNRSPKEGQQYAFRLLCSEDGNLWKVLFDSTNTEKQYRVGWVHIIFRDKEDPNEVNSGVQNMRYFRIHALHNPVSSGFHVVRLRLFNIENKLTVDNNLISEENTNNKNKVEPLEETIVLYANGCYDYEINDTTPLATKLLNIAERLHRGVSKKFGSINDLPSGDRFDDVYNHVIEKAFELQAVDGRVDQVRKIITPLISKKLEDKKIDNIKSTRREWLITFILLIIYIIVCVTMDFQNL